MVPAWYVTPPRPAARAALGRWRLPTRDRAVLGDDRGRYIHGVRKATRRSSTGGGRVTDETYDEQYSQKEPKALRLWTIGLLVVLLAGLVMFVFLRMREVESRMAALGDDVGEARERAAQATRQAREAEAAAAAAGVLVGEAKERADDEAQARPSPKKPSSQPKARRISPSSAPTWPRVPHGKHAPRPTVFSLSAMQRCRVCKMCSVRSPTPSAPHWAWS